MSPLLRRFTDPRVPSGRAMEAVAGNSDRLGERGCDFKWERASMKSPHGLVCKGVGGLQREPEQRAGVHAASARRPKVVWTGWDDCR